MPVTPTTVDQVPFGAVVAHLRRQLTIEGLSPRQVAAATGLPAAQIAALAGTPTPTPTAGGGAGSAAGGGPTVRLAAGGLHIDRTYQRDLDPRWIRRRVARFTPALLGTLEVSDRGPGAPAGTRWAVIDGQHRQALTLAVAGPDHWLDCRIHTGLAVADEAALYRLIDANRRSLTRWDRWKARRAEGDPTVLEIEQVIADARLRLAPTRTGGTVTSARAAEQLHTLGGPDLLAAALDVVVGAWAYREPVDHDVLVGVGLVRHHYRAADLADRRISTGLADTTPDQLRARARALREVHRTNQPRLVAGVVVELVNNTRGHRWPALAPFHVHTLTPLAAAA